MELVHAAKFHLQRIVSYISSVLSHQDADDSIVKPRELSVFTVETLE